MIKKITALMMVVLLAITSLPLSTSGNECESIEENTVQYCVEPELSEQMYRALIQKRTAKLQEELYPSRQLKAPIDEIYSTTSLTPSTGNVKMLVLPIAFPDYPEVREAYDENALYEKYFAETGLGSLRGFYYASSYGKLDITGTVLPVYETPEASDLYNYDLNANYDQKASWWEVISNALQENIDNGLDISEYDSDGDGYLDALSVEMLLPESAYFLGYQSAFRGVKNNFGGIKLDVYFTTGIITGGLIVNCHEMAHMLGLPDNYPDSFGESPDKSVLDSGLRELTGESGSGWLINMYYKYLLDWIEPVILTNEDNALEEIAIGYDWSMGDEPKAVILVPDPSELPFSEYYVAEYRETSHTSEVTGAYENRKGVVLWHIDAFLNEGKFNYINKSAYIKPVYKSGVSSRRSYNSGKLDLYIEGDVFSYNSSPVNSDFYNGVYSGAYVEVLDLQEDKATIRAGFRVRPTGTVSYSTTSPTSQNVSATLNVAEGITILNNGGNNTYSFSENGSFDFQIRNEAGIEATVKAEVNWIDRIVPTATIEYSTTSPTNRNVIATIIPSEEIKLTNNSGNKSHTFTENGSFTFEFEDTAGNAGTATAIVSNIDKIAPTAGVSYSPSNKTTGSVVVMIEFSEEVEITQNAGKLVEQDNNLTYTSTFTENDFFEIKFLDNAGNMGIKIISVDWIEKAPLDPPPYVPPIIPPGGNLVSVTFDYQGATSKNDEISRDIEAGYGIGELPEPERDGYIFDGWYTKPNGGGDKLSADTIIIDAMVIYASWVAKGKPPAKEKFKDIDESKWYYDAVEYVYQNDIFTGTSETEFSPDISMNRAMVATVIWRLAGEPKETGTSKFTDVPKGAFYHDAVVWANTLRIILGKSETEYDPSDEVSRQDLAVMLYRYMGKLSKADLSRFSDSDKISTYAVEAMIWAVSEGIISGRTNGTLDPQGNAKRAEVAAMLMRIAGKP